MEINFKHRMQMWLLWRQNDDKIRLAVCELMAQQRVGNGKGRIEPSGVKHRPKTYPLMTVQRSLAREQVRENDHHNDHCESARHP